MSVPSSSVRAAFESPSRATATRSVAGSVAPKAAKGREIDLDFVRGVAILMVLDYHAPVHWMSYPLHLLGFPLFGWAGVDVFFILSGFLVGGLLMKEWRVKGAVDSRRFLIRRGFKIWPQYYVFLALMLLTHHRTVQQLWGNLLNLQNYFGGIPHTWSLAVEEHAYLLLVLVIALAAKLDLAPSALAWLLGGASLAVSAGRIYLARNGHAVFNRTHTRIEGILEGVLIALVYHHWPELFTRLQAKRGLWLALLLAALLFLRFQGTAPWAQSLGWDAANLLGVALLMLLYRPGRVRSPSRLYTAVAWIGVYSYGIYLWHVAVIAPSTALAGRLPRGVAVLCLALLPIAAGIGIGAIFTRLVELPALAVRDRLFPRRVESPLGAPADEQREVLKETGLFQQSAELEPGS